MKNFQSIILIALLFISSFSYSQNNFSLGLAFGVTYSNIRGNDFADDNTYAFDYLIGGTANYHFKENLSLKLEVDFERKSFKNKIEQFEFDTNDPRIIGRELTTTLEYLSVPVLLQYKFGAQKNFFINGGPFAAFLLSNKAKINKETVDANFDDTFETLDYGITLGVGTRIEFSNYNWLLIEIRHNYGLNNISKVPVYEDGSIKTNVFNLVFNWEMIL